MPELPEVETVKRELEKFLVKKRSLKVSVLDARVLRGLSSRSFARMLANVSVKKVLRRGKTIIIELSNKKFLVVHLKMTGQLVYPGSIRKQTRVVFHLATGKLLTFNDMRVFGELRVLDDWRSLLFIKKLGPEPYEISSVDFKDMLRSKTTKIKPLLMDQTFIAGIGNLYAAEVLFRAKINPSRPANRLSGKEKELLFNEIIDTLNEAIRHKGSSIDQYVQLDGSQGRFVEHHQVYDRKGEPCFVCKTPIQRIALGGRGTYFCPKCQK
jgi:formamidopyrimidine-DNA glycosylase